MYFCRDMDYAFKEDRIRRKKDKELQEKIAKIEALINDPACCTEGERQSAKLKLKKLKDKEME